MAARGGAEVSIDRMLGIDAKAARAAWTIVLVGAGLAAAYQIRAVILIFVLALLFAYMLNPLVALAARIRPAGVPRVAVLAALYLVMLAILGYAGVTAGARMAREASALSEKLPQILQDPNLIEKLPLPEWLLPYRSHFVEEIRGAVEEHLREALPMISSLSLKILGMLGNAVFLLLIPILAFFFLMDAEQYRDGLISLFGGANPERVQGLFADLHVLLAQYVRALVLLSLATFLAYSIGLSLLGVPFAALLAFVAALGEFVPVAGTFGAKIVIIIVAALAGYSGFLWLILFLLAYRLFLDYVLQPKLLGAGVELPPLVVIFAVLAGEQMGGIVGAMLAIPVAAALRAVLVRRRKDPPGAMPT